VGRHQVYILPTPYGYAFSAMLLVLLLWAINYSNSLGFALTFLLGAVALNAMWRTNNNLLHLRVHPATTEPEFAGREARFGYRIDNPALQVRYGVALQWQDSEPVYADIPAKGFADLQLLIPAPRRGLLRPGRLRLHTCFPLGLFRAWSWVEFDEACLIYPPPRGERVLPGQRGVAAGVGAWSEGHGGEDYAGLRSYAPGDSPRHVAWKALARMDELMVKQFNEPTGSELWLEWDGLAPAGGEDRLAQLCQWVLKGAAQGLCYGLRLPGTVIGPGQGDGHRRRCLEALALCRYP
jgi:uncharacterized protein (DUF58 family)